MPRPYSTGLRERVLAACERGLTIEEVSRQFEVGKATVKRWGQLQRHTGSVKPAPHGGNPPRVAGKGLELVYQLVREQPDLAVEEIAPEYHARTSVPVSRATMGRTRERLELTRKKKSLAATERKARRVMLLRAVFLLLHLIGPSRLVFLDKSGSHIAMTRENARAPRWSAQARVHQAAHRGDRSFRPLLAAVLARPESD